MGIKLKWEQCGYDKRKLLFSKIVTWVYFICTLQCSPFTSIFLEFSLPVVIIPSGLWEARGQHADTGSRGIIKF